MLPLRLRLLRLVTGEPSNGTADRASNAILHTTTEILHLALSLLALAISILLNALLQRADVLVPRAGGAVGVIFCDAAGCGGGEGAGFGGCVGEVLLGGGFELAVFALGLGDGLAGWVGKELGGRMETYLVGGAAGERAESALCGALGLVEVALAGGSLVLGGRHGSGLSV
jgi:hypothetical protein